jgi:ADP-ribosylglycohydrolase
MLHASVRDRQQQGYAVDGLDERLDALPDSYDAMFAFAHELTELPLRPDWPYVEPNDLEGILAACDPAAPREPVGWIGPDEAAARAASGFLGSVCGCILGKPVEVSPTAQELRAAAEAVGEWPIDDYVSEALLETLGRRHGSWTGTVRGRIEHVVPDDDLNYPVLGMLLLERHGLGFTKDDLRRLWKEALPVGWCWGPERTLNLKIGLGSLEEVWLGIWGASVEDDVLETWVEELNPGVELCGALIRVDAYGYAAPGNPALAAELAWRDASFTHRRTGIYASMFLAAAIAAAFVASDPLEPFRQALRFVPARSRFHEAVAEQLEIVGNADRWEDANAELEVRFGSFGACQVFQEIGDLMTAVRFAESVGHGICLQVSQGLDTDSFGARAGAILGVLFGPGHLEERWLAPFHDEIRTTVAVLYETSLHAVAGRMGALTGLSASS